MKKLFSLIALVAVLSFGIGTVHAQTSNQCGAISTSNYPICCPINTASTPVAQILRCNTFKANTCATTPSDPICQNAGQVGSGGTTPNTNPTNGGTTTPTIASTPQASSSELLSCNGISFDSLLDILIWLKCVIGAAIVPLVFTLAFLYFLWGMVMFIKGADDVKKREESKKFIYWGIIGLTVMIGVWGIVRIVTSTFGFGNTVPQLQTDCLTTDSKNPCK